MKRVTTFIPIIEGENIIKDLKRRKKLSKSKGKDKDIQEEIEEEYKDLVKRMDKIFEKEFGRFAQLIAGDNGKAEEIRFFIDVDKEKVKVNENTLYVYHKYIIPISENIIREQGLIL